MTANVFFTGAGLNKKLISGTHHFSVLRTDVLGVKTYLQFVFLQH